MACRYVWLILILWLFAVQSIVLLVVKLSFKYCKTGYPCKACIFKGGHDPSPGNDPAGTTWGELTTWVDDSTWSYFKKFY